MERLNKKNDSQEKSTEIKKHIMCIILHLFTCSKNQLFQWLNMQSFHFKQKVLIKNLDKLGDLRYCQGVITHGVKWSLILMRFLWVFLNKSNFMKLIIQLWHNSKKMLYTWELITWWSLWSILLMKQPTEMY